MAGKPERYPTLNWLTSLFRSFTSLFSCSTAAGAATRTISSWAVGVLKTKEAS